jgi:hypothetical protein
LKLIPLTNACHSLPGLSEVEPGLQSGIYRFTNPYTEKSLEAVRWQVGGYPSEFETDPHGATSGVYRIIRGGDYDHIAFSQRCARRKLGRPANCDKGIGFRLARR